MIHHVVFPAAFGDIGLALARHWVVANRACCELMQAQWDSCAQHPDPMDCPDLLVTYVPKFSERGIPVRNGENGSASSYSQIEYCPSCGARLPGERRDVWFDELERRGLDLGARPGVDDTIGHRTLGD